MLFVTVMRCNALKGAVALRRNKAQHCSYLHARILHPCYFTHDELWWWWREQNVRCPSLRYSHARISSTQTLLCETAESFTDKLNR